MGGSCSMPLAAHAVIEGGVLQLRAAWGDPEGVATLVRADAQASAAGLAAAEALGLSVAQALRDGGAH
jgi:hydroxymethylbilane synthase